MHNFSTFGLIEGNLPGTVKNDLISSEGTECSGSLANFFLLGSTRKLCKTCWM